MTYRHGMLEHGIALGCAKAGEKSRSIGLPLRLEAQQTADGGGGSYCGGAAEVSPTAPRQLRLIVPAR
ncbi:hypothetical protein ABZ511_31235 [Nocardia gamkensis]|uniref:hypothetical protein n=1 Tax=Nocardia gamkensis TaxID=352869 RepID=UPI0033E71BC4